MNNYFLLLLINCLSLFITAGCNNSVSPVPPADKNLIAASIQGQWIEADNIEYIQGFSLEENGLAREIGTRTLTYSAWNLSGNQLMLTGKSIGNGQTIDFIDTLEIIRMDSILVVKNSRDVEIKYKHPDKN